jgi:hypothetical protein
MTEILAVSSRELSRATILSLVAGKKMSLTAAAERLGARTTESAATAPSGDVAKASECSAPPSRVANANAEHATTMRATAPQA